MDCTRIALYDITSGSDDEVVDRARIGMIPLFEHSPGLVSYGVALIDTSPFVSLSTWHTREQANAATSEAAGWVVANAGDQFVLRKNYVGDLAVHIIDGQCAELVQ